MSKLRETASTSVLNAGYAATDCLADGIAAGKIDWKAVLRAILAAAVSVAPLFLQDEKRPTNP